MNTATSSFQLVSVPVDRLAQLARMGPEFYAEGKLPGAFDPVAFIHTWTNLLAAGTAHIFALEEQGQFVGALGAIIYPDPNDAAPVATEMFWFVRQGHRGSGFVLLDAFEHWAKERGAKRISMVHLVSLMPAVLERVYKARGYRHIESHYMKDV